MHTVGYSRCKIGVVAVQVVDEANWELLTFLERKLREEESPWQKHFDRVLGYSPWAPTPQALTGFVGAPFAASIVINKGPSGLKVSCQVTVEKLANLALKFARRGR